MIYGPNSVEVGTIYINWIEYELIKFDGFAMRKQWLMVVGYLSRLTYSAISLHIFEKYFNNYNKHVALMFNVSVSLLFKSSASQRYQ